MGKISLPKTSQHGSASPTTNASGVHPTQAAEDILLVDTGFTSLVELTGEDVEHQLAVAIGIDVSVGLSVQKGSELLRIDQITIVSESDTVWTVDIEGLCLGARAASCSRISQVAQAHEAGKILNTAPIVEDLGSHAISLALVYPTP